MQILGQNYRKEYVLRFLRAVAFLRRHTHAQIMNRMKSRTGYNRLEVRHYPTRLSIDVTTMCNMNCPFCSTAKYRAGDPSQCLSLSEAKTLLKKYRLASRASFCGLGETFLNPDLFAISRYAKNQKMTVYVTTNGTLLQKRMSEVLTSGIDKLEISLKGVSEEEYQRVTGRRPDEFHSILDAIKRLSEASNRPKIYMSYVCDRRRAHDIPKVLEIAVGCGVDEIILQNLICEAGSEMESDCLYEHDREWVLKLVDRNSSKSSGLVVSLPGFYSRDSIRRRCPMPFECLRIGVDGGVSGCSRAHASNVKQGNAFLDKDVFNSKHFVNLRAAHLDNTLPLPYECIYCHREG